MDRAELEKCITDLKKQMNRAASELNFEAAADLRDQMLSLRKMIEEMKEDK